MQSQDFTAILEITDENLIKELDKLEEVKSNKEFQIGMFDYLNNKLSLLKGDDVFKVKMEKSKRSKQNFVIEIDNSEYVDYTNYVDHMEEYRKNHGRRRIDDETLKSIIRKQKEEHQKRVHQSKQSNIFHKRNLGRFFNFIKKRRKCLQSLS